MIGYYWVLLGIRHISIFKLYLIGCKKPLSHQPSWYPLIRPMAPTRGADHVERREHQWLPPWNRETAELWDSANVINQPQNQQWLMGWINMYKPSPNGLWHWVSHITDHWILRYVAYFWMAESVSYARNKHERLRFEPTKRVILP